MLSQHDNELLTRVGPGTPMGELMRRYWMPALVSTELPEADGAPYRVRLLGEDLVAWRNTDGSVGLMQNACPHRGASMFFGRNEENGLRCVYHGWKFDVDGNCVDMPNEPAESNFKHKIHATAYPCVEKGGVIWAWMGTGEAPELPKFEANTLPPTHVRTGRRYQETNFMQALEGGIDSSHASFLHSQLSVEPGQSVAASLASDARRPAFEVVEVENGLVIGAKRPMADGSEYWRVNLFQMPFYTYSPGDELCHWNAWVPMDDETTLRVSVVWNPVQPITEEYLAEKARQVGRRQYLPGGFIAPGDLLPRTTQPGGAWRAKANKDNDYLLDREFQRTKKFSGVDGGNIGTEDLSVQEGMGRIMDRTREHLGTTDMGVIATRRMLMRAAAANQEHGTTPPGVANAEAYFVRSPGFIVEAGADWLSAAREAMRAKPGVPYQNANARGRARLA